MISSSFECLLTYFYTIFKKYSLFFLPINSASTYPVPSLSSHCASWCHVVFKSINCQNSRTLGILVIATNITKSFNFIINTHISILCFLGMKERNMGPWKILIDPFSSSIQPIGTSSHYKQQKCFIIDVMDLLFSFKYFHLCFCVIFIFNGCN